MATRAVLSPRARPGLVAFCLAIALCAAGSLAAPGAAPASRSAAPIVMPFLALPANSPHHVVATLATPQGALTASDGAPYDNLGESVAISGDTAIVGVRNHTVSGFAGAGAAYVYTRSAGVWTFQQELTVDVPASNDGFGIAVAISGDTALVGSESHYVTSTGRRGSVTVFTRTADTWTQSQELYSTDGTGDDSYGQAVALQGDTALVGAMGHGTPGDYHGCVYAYTRSGGVFGSAQVLTGDDVVQAEYFGTSVAVDGDTAVVGAFRHNHGGAGSNSGAAFVFARSGGVWTQQQELDGDNVTAGDNFGASVAISGDTVLVGARTHYYLGQQMGSAYVFTRSGTAWTQEQQLTPSDGANYDTFGFSVALAGDTALIGSTFHDDTMANKSGAGYVFTRSGATWTQYVEFSAAGSAADDRFGNAVALSSGSALVGAPGHAVGGHAQAGAAYAFLLADITPLADTTPPVTTVTVVPTGWSKTSATVTMSATDDSPGVITTQYRLQNALSWSTYATPFTVSTQGTSTYEYRSFDAVPNYEVTRTFQTHVDALGPQTLALAKVSVKKGKKATFKFRVNDVTPSAKVTIKIYKGKKLIKKVPAGSQATNTAKSYKWTCKLAKGSYVWKVYATDQAKNPQTSIGSKTLKVT